MAHSETAARNRAIKRTLYRLWGRGRRIQVFAGRGSDRYSVYVYSDHPELADAAQARRLRRAALCALTRAKIKLDGKPHRLRISFAYSIRDNPDRCSVTGLVTSPSPIYR